MFFSLYFQGAPKVISQLSSTATACYALAISSDGNVSDMQ